MEKISKATKFVCSATSLLGRIFLILFALMFAAVGIAALVSAIIDSDFFGVIGCGACAFLAWTCWSIRRTI